MIDMKFLVTGGAGFIGSHIAEELLKKGEVVVFDDLSVGSRNNVNDKCTFVRGDIRNIDSVKKVMDGIDVVFHNAAFVSIRGSFQKLTEDFETNCIGALNVIKSAAEAGIKKFIFASSMAVYGEPNNVKVKEEDCTKPISPYGLSKLRGELYCKIFEEEFGMKSVVLRYFNTYGTRQTESPYVGVITTFINQALRKKPLTVYGDGKQTRDFVWVRDIVQANMLSAFSNAGGIFNVGSGNEISVNDVADAVIKNVGGEKIYVDSPAGEISRICADISKGEKVLGYKPGGKLGGILPEIIDWWSSKANI